MPERPFNTLPLEWIRAFEAAGRTGSFTAAARETGLTQAAISQRIGNLEKQIGARLFSRQARGVTLTVDGEAWMPYASNALNTLRQSAEELFGVQDKKIVISASASVIQRWLAPRLAGLNSDDRFQIAFTTMVLRSDFLQHDATVEVRYGNGSWPGKYRARLFAEALSPVCAPDICVPGGNWQSLPKIAVSGPRVGWQDWSKETADPATPIPKIRFDSFASALAAARSGIGVLLGSLPLITEDLENCNLTRLSDHALFPEESYWMTASKNGITQRQWDRLAALFCNQASA